MAVEESADDGEQTELQGENGENGRSGINRRSALKKAAVGAGVATGAWVAPRIDGLSLMPDYASAATIKGTFSFKRSSNDLNAYYTDLTDCWGNDNCNPAATVVGLGNVNENATITWQGRADINGNGRADVVFHTDPPFNHCKVTAITGSVGCCLGDFHSGGVTATSAVWDTTQHTAGTAQGNDVTLTIKCD